MSNAETIVGKNIAKKDAQAIAGALKIIGNDDDSRETAKKLVEFARPKTSALHHLFEWDDRKAADEQRIGHAMYLIRHVYVVFEKQPARPVRAFPILVHNGVRGPVPMKEVMASKDLTASLLNEAKAEMLRFRRKYEGLAALSDVFAAMDKALKRL